MTKPIQVEVYDGNIEKALKDLKKKMAFEGVYREIKRRRFYLKPSVEKKLKREEAMRRLKKREKRMQSRYKNRGPGRSGPGRSGPGSRPGSNTAGSSVRGNSRPAGSDREK